MDVLTAIKSRRSVRAYKTDLVPKDVFEQIVEAGTWAPNGRNMQSWHFSVIQGRDVMLRINAECKKRMAALDDEALRKAAADPATDVTRGASAFIIASAREDDRNGPINCCAAMQNMMLAAHSLGVGSCWIGTFALLFGDKDMMRGFGVPEGYKPYQAAVFGYPAMRPDAPERKQDVASYVGTF
jgi:nitroreductase